MHVIAFRIQGEVAGAMYNVFGPVLPGLGLVFVERRPRAQVAPPYVYGDAEQVRCMFPLSGARLRAGIFHADVSAVRVQSAEGSLELPRAEGGRNFLQVRRSLGEVLAHPPGQRTRPPQEHAAVPEIPA